MTYSTLKRGGPLRQRSEKRVKEDAEFAKVRKAVMKRDGHCMAPIDWGLCGGPWDSLSGGLWDAHHIVSRARDKTLALEPSNLITLCRRHHDWVHDHPLEAEAFGLLKSAPLLSPQPNQGNER